MLSLQAVFQPMVPPLVTITSRYQSKDFFRYRLSEPVSFFISDNLVNNPHGLRSNRRLIG